MNDEELQQMYTNMTPDAQTHQLEVQPNVDAECGTYEGNVVKDKAIAFVAALSLTGLVVVYGTVDWNGDTGATYAAQYVAPRIIESVPQPPEHPHPFNQVGIQARSAAIYDINNERFLYAKSADTQRPLASLTKLMTALLVVESTDINKNIAISPNAIHTEGDSGLFANESWKLKDLVSFTMLTSSNDGADALATAVGSLWSSTPAVSDDTKVNSFVRKMNARAGELGLNETEYRNATGLDVSTGTTGALGSAADMSLLMAHIWENAPAAIAGTDEIAVLFTSEDGFVHEAENTNEHVYTVPGLMGSKTGYTDLAGGNLAIVYDAGLNHPIVVVVLGSTLEGRFDDVDTLVEATHEYVVSGWYEYEMVAGSTPRS